jgi:hypothetical protein
MKCRYGATSRPWALTFGSCVMAVDHPCLGRCGSQPVEVSVSPVRIVAVASTVAYPAALWARCATMVKNRQVRPSSVGVDA